MLILSKIRDYYDSVLGLGIDKTIVYRREQSEIELGEQPSIYSGKDKRYPEYHYLGWRDEDECCYDAVPIMVGVGGKVYPCYRVEYRDRTAFMAPLVHDFVFDIESLKEVIAKVDKRALQQFIEKKQDKKSKHIRWCEDNCIAYFAADHTHTHAHFFTDHNVPVFSVTYPDRARDVLSLNPCLKDIKMFRVLDPFTAFQDISMFLSGVLGVGEPVMIQINDKLMAQKRGFDNASFRTASPGKKANRRK